MSAPLNRTEEFVSQVCARSFLTFWCYPNPQAPNGKELCDLLVVCHPHVIVVSVKEIALNSAKDPEVAHARWERKAVDASISQIYGAERTLDRMTRVVRRDGSVGLDLPPKTERKIHRIAVAFGDNNQAVTKSGDYDKGYVHVMSAPSFTDVLTELDTIGDFTDYLAAKQELRRVICEGSEANMLAWYLTNDRTFPTGKDVVVFDDTLWRSFQTSEAFRRRKAADAASYAWDRLIEAMSDPTLVPLEGPGPTPSELDHALRTMAKESRFHRRLLGEHGMAFIQAAREGKLRSRILGSPSGVIYVFVYFTKGEDPEWRRAEMVGHSYLARKRAGKGEVVVGIGMSPHQPGIGSLSELTYVNFPRWSEVEMRRADEYERITGSFVGQPTVRLSSKEYPADKPKSANGP